MQGTEACPRVQMMEASPRATNTTVVTTSSNSPTPHIIEDNSDDKEYKSNNEP